MMVLCLVQKFIRGRKSGTWWCDTLYYSHAKTRRVEHKGVSHSPGGKILYHTWSDLIPEVVVLIWYRIISVQHWGSDPQRLGENYLDDIVKTKYNEPIVTIHGRTYTHTHTDTTDHRDHTTWKHEPTTGDRPVSESLSNPGFSRITSWHIRVRLGCREKIIKCPKFPFLRWS